MYKRAIMLTWGLAFVLAEVIGIGFSYLAYVQGIGEVLSGCITDVIIVVARFLFLTYIAKISRVSPANAIYKPSLTGKGLAILFIVATYTIIFDYYITIIATNGAYEPQLLGYSYYLKQNMLWDFRSDSLLLF